jgi:hypothetical protein
MHMWLFIGQIKSSFCSTPDLTAATEPCLMGLEDSDVMAQSLTYSLHVG